MRILVTGISGFIGGRFAQLQSALGNTVAGVSRSPAGGAFCWSSNDGPPTEILSQFQPDVIVHAAGNSDPRHSLAEPALDFQANVSTTLGLLEAMRIVGSKARFILLSSAAVYGEPARLPITESDETNPMSPYGFHKLQAEGVCREYHEIHGIDFSVLRIFSAYGPGLRRQVVFDCGLRALKGGLVLHGTGEESRDFIYVDDVARAIGHVASDSRSSGRIFNLASGEETSIRRLGEDILSALQLPGDLTFDGTSQPGLPLRWKADMAALRNIGFECQVSRSEGIRETLDWIVKNYRMAPASL